MEQKSSKRFMGKLHNVVWNLCPGWHRRSDSKHRGPADTDGRSLMKKCGTVDHRGAAQIWRFIDLKTAQPLTALPQLLTCRLRPDGWRLPGFNGLLWCSQKKLLQMDRWLQRGQPFTAHRWNTRGHPFVDRHLLHTFWSQAAGLGKSSSTGTVFCCQGGIERWAVN